jgi:hypothetical protein
MKDEAAVTYASPTIECPEKKARALPAAFHACGTIDKKMWVRECFFLAGAQRRDADTIKSADGKWSAKFS